MHHASMNEWSCAVLVAVVALAQGCADRGRAAEAHGAREPHAPPIMPLPNARGVEAPIVLVTIDGVRWQEVFEGADGERVPSTMDAATLLPNLHRLGTAEGAFVGAPGQGTISASGPNYVSLPGYNEILGGRRSGCTDNECARTSIPTLLDEARAHGAKVAAFASWERLDLASTSRPGSFHVSCGRGWNPLVDPYPGHGDYRPDAKTAEEALAYFEKEQPDVFFLGLGDPDEYAHRDDYPGYLASLRQADAVVGRLAQALDRMGERGRRAHIVVTSDHGRAHGFRDHGGMPEAARVWMVASGPRFLARGAVASPAPRRLADVAPTLRLVLGLPPDTSFEAGTELDELFAARASL